MQLSTEYNAQMSVYADTFSTILTQHSAMKDTIMALKKRVCVRAKIVSHLESELEAALEKHARLRDEHDEEKRVLLQHIDTLNHVHLGMMVNKSDKNEMEMATQTCFSLDEVTSMMARQRIEALERAVSEEQRKRRVLSDQLNENLGTIRVFCRVRPLLKHEVDNAEVAVAVHTQGHDEVQLVCWHIFYNALAPAEQLHFIIPCSLKNVIHLLYIYIC